MDEIYAVHFESVNSEGEIVREFVGVASTHARAQVMVGAWALDRFNAGICHNLSWTSFQGRTDAYEVRQEDGARVGIATIVRTEPDLMLWRLERSLSIRVRI